MTLIEASAEEAVIELLQRSGPCCLDDLVTQLPNFSWSEVFLAVDRMSREGLVLLRRRPGSVYYYVALSSQPPAPCSPSRQREGQS